MDLTSSPEEKLLARIPFFGKMFKSGCKEEIENFVTFIDNNPGDFELLIDWVYMGASRQIDIRPY